MLLQAQSSTPHFLPPIFSFKSTLKPQFITFKPTPLRRLSLKCSLSMVSDPSTATTQLEFPKDRPFLAEVSRTIMDLSSVGTLSISTPEGWPLGVGVRFAVDHEGTPVLCLSESCKELCVDMKSSLHLEQCGLRTPQCTIQGSLHKPQDRMFLKVSEAKLIWVDRLGFDMRIYSPQKGAFDVRIPFPTEVTDEKGAKSSFNCMSQQAWEIEKNYQAQDFKKVKQLKQITYGQL
ncbi:hypothetical protein JRO89_XS09G0064300 [Xanthoceras sorbifolium]|uniref:DUF2470 domain-containing protein n=1 Tax=Xanthoceras sorbifolium TaxID=99658 RepID=A0ABQ8HKL9_9ROSI|nr:hypothetical protein JRO89_XS09G0064300 [Xanthoceras sorbifolium]